MPNPVTRSVTAVRTAVVVAKGHRWARTFVGSLLSLLGLCVLLIELARYWMLGHPIHAAPVCIGCVIGFIGAFVLSPREAKEGAQIIVDSGIRVIGAVRPGGRRSTDTPVVVPSKTEEKP